MKTAANGNASERERKNPKVKFFCNKCYNLSNKKRIDSKNREYKHLKTKKGRQDHLQYQFTPTQTGSTRERPTNEGSDKRARGLSPQFRKRAAQGVAGGAGGRLPRGKSHQELLSQKRKRLEQRTNEEGGSGERGANRPTGQRR